MFKWFRKFNIFWSQRHYIEPLNQSFDILKTTFPLKTKINLIFTPWIKSSLGKDIVRLGHFQTFICKNGTKEYDIQIGLGSAHLELRDWIETLCHEYRHCIQEETGLVYFNGKQKMFKDYPIPSKYTEIDAYSACPMEADANEFMKWFFPTIQKILDHPDHSLPVLQKASV